MTTEIEKLKKSLNHAVEVMDKMQAQLEAVRQAARKAIHDERQRCANVAREYVCFASNPVEVGTALRIAEMIESSLAPTAAEPPAPVEALAVRDEPSNADPYHPHEGLL